MEGFDDHFPANLRNKPLCGSTIDDKPPWNPDELPEHLRGLGYRGADQDGYDGEGLVGDRGACLGAGGVEIGDVLDLKKKKRN